MEVTIFLLDGTEITKECNVDPMGVTYEKERSGIILPDDPADAITLVLVPWASILKVEYTITPADVEEAGLDQPTPNRKARRAGLQG